MLGTLVSCASYRPAAVTVKMARNLQAVSGGRFCFGVGAGWDEAEFEALGIPFGSAGERSDRLEEVLRLARAGSPGGAARPLLLAGGEGERRTLPAAVRQADLVNWQVGTEEFARMSRVLARLCEEAGRDPASLRRTHAPNFQLFDSDREFRLWRQHPDRGMSAAEVDAYIRRRGAFYGTASAIGATIDEFISLGCGGFVVFINESPALAGLEHTGGRYTARHRRRDLHFSEYRLEPQCADYAVRVGAYPDAATRSAGGAGHGRPGCTRPCRRRAERAAVALHRDIRPLRLVLLDMHGVTNPAAVRAGDR